MINCSQMTLVFVVSDKYHFEETTLGLYVEEYTAISIKVVDECSSVGDQTERQYG